MHAFRTPFFSALLLIALGACHGLTAQCLGGSQPCHPIPGGNLSDVQGGPFLTGNTYVLTGPVIIPAGQQLTIQPGAVVKIVPEFTILNTIEVRGRLVAQGTATQPIFITSYIDDGPGGDTNGGGGLPAPGDWKSIAFVGASGSTQPNLLSHCVVRYGGRQNRPLLLANENCVIDRCEFAFGGNAQGIRIQQGDNPVVTNCDFHDLGRAFDRVSMTGLELLTGNTASNIVQGNNRLDVTSGSSGTQVVGPTQWTKANTLNGSGVVVVNVTINVASTASLTLGPGMVLKFLNSGQGLNAIGPLTTQGTSAEPVVFTSLGDPQHAPGVTAGGPPAPGDWVGLQFLGGSSASSVSHTLVRYAGAQSPAAVRLQSSNATFDHLAVDFSLTAGLTATQSSPSVTNSSFDDNLRAIGQLPISAVAGFTGNSAVNNVESDALAIGGGNLNSTLTLGPQNYLGGGALVLAESFAIEAAGVLTLQAGTVFKAEAGKELSVSGTLTAQGTAQSPVVFTSVRDDSVGGDTNKDGTQTSPSPGDWAGLEFTSGSSASSLTRGRVSYGGFGGAGGVSLISSSATLDTTTVDQSSGAGLFVSGGQPLSLKSCAFDDNGGAPIRGVRIGQLAGITGCTAQGNGAGDDIRITATTLTSSLTVDPVNTLNQSGSVVFTGNLTVSGGATLTLLPQVALKFDGLRKLEAFGAISCPVGPVWITAVGDDLTPTGGTAQPGDWGGLLLRGNGTNLVNVEVRFTGGTGIGTLLGQDDITLQNCRFASSAVAGLQCGINTSPTVVGCQFDDNARVLHASTSITNLENFDGNTGSGNAGGDFIEVSSMGGLQPVIAPRMGLNGTGVLVVPNTIQNASNQVLTVDAGAILKFKSSVALLLVDALFCNGTSSDPVVMTSFFDDQFGGDTDGTPQPPMPGDWQGLVFGSSSDASVLEHTVIRYAGAGGDASIELQQADITLLDVTIENGAGAGIDLNGNSAPTITGGSINNNGGNAIAGMTWGGLGKISGVTASGNTGDTFTVIDSPFVSGDVVIYPHSYFGDSLVVNVSPQMSLGKSITFMPGCVVKAGDPSVEFDFRGGGGGVIGTARDPVVLTSVHDDDFGGSVGGGASPSPGDWVGVYLGGPMEHALVRYAGAGGIPGLRAIGGTIEGCRVEHCLDDGYGLGVATNIPVTGTAANSIAYANGGDGFDVAGGYTLIWCTSAGNDGLGITGGVNLIAVYATNSWGNTAGNFPTLMPQYRSVSSSPGWRVAFSNGLQPIGPCPPPVPPFGICYQWGVQNTNVDPQFVDLANGDLHLASTSPLLGSVPLNGLFPTSPQSNFPWDSISRAVGIGAADGEDNSRLADHDLGGPGPFLADVGAFEAAAFQLEVEGDGQLESSLVIKAAGAPGVFAPQFGFQPDAQPPFVIVGIGAWLLGDFNAVVSVGTITTGNDVTIPIPDQSSLVGVQFAIQAIAIPFGGGGGGGGPTLTNVHRGEFY